MWPDLEALLRQHAIPQFTVDAHRPVGAFDLLGVSFSTELGYTNLLTALDLAAIPLHAVDRTMEHPVVIAGGHAAFNPEPIADFVDAAVLGDGEEAVLEITDIVRAWKAEGRIAYLGVTHYTESAYRELEAVMRQEALDFVQLNYAVDDRAAEKRLLPLAADRGIAVLVNQPFGGGDLLRRLRTRALPDWAAEIGCESWAQILLKFVLGHPAVTCVIPGTGKPEHMRDDLRAGTGPMPDQAFRARMASSLGL